MLPSYLALAADGRLEARAAAALDRLAACTLCARRCGADRRNEGGRAACGIGRRARLHPPDRTPGTIRFAGCTLRCLYCPTPEASWEGVGVETGAADLATLMLERQEQGCPTLTLYRPSHVAAQILEALPLAVARGFRLPLAWDSNGYDSLETLALLDGVIDIYRVDMRYGDSAVARQCSGVTAYAETNRAVVAEMHRQVGDNLQVRHMVLPNGLAGTRAVLDALPPGAAIAITDDYRPHFRADRHPKLNRPATDEEVAAARR